MAGLAATFSPPAAPTKRNKNKRKHKKRKKDPGNGRQTGSCTLDQTADASILLVEVADSHDDKPLTLVHRATLPSAGDFSQQLVVTLGQQLVVQFDVDVGNPNESVSRLRARYGTGFHGIQQSEFIIIIGGKSIGGSIDGRESAPRPVEDVAQDPDGWEFVDGGPPPETSTDRDLLAAVQSMLNRAEDEAAKCAGGQLRVAAATVAVLRMMPGLPPASDWLGGGVASARKAKRKLSTRKRAGRVRAEETNPTVCDEASDGCLACWAGCFLTVSGCCAATLGLGCAACYAAYELCLAGCDGSVCCPVECGNDFPVAEIQFCDYVFNTIDLLKIAGNTCWASNGDWNLPMVVMTPVGSGIRGSIYHSHSFDATATRIPGLEDRHAVERRSTPTA